MDQTTFDAVVTCFIYMYTEGLFLSLRKSPFVHRYLHFTLCKMLGIKAWSPRKSQELISQFPAQLGCLTIACSFGIADAVLCICPNLGVQFWRVD